MTAAELKIRANRRKLVIQGLLILGAVLVVWSAISSAQTNLARLGLASGFDFLERGTGWSYSFSLIERDINDSYSRTLMIGLMNTVFVGAISIVLSTILGFIVGSMRDMRNLAVSSAATVFVQVFRNVPLILQVIFWYSVAIHLPGPRQAISVADMVFMSNRGIMVPVLNVPLGAALILLVALLLMAFVLIWKKLPPLKVFLIWLGGTVALTFLTAMVAGPSGESMISVPELKGLRFVGGLNISIEFAVMILAIVLYSSAYIAEVVRGGLKEVPKGQIEAGQALGLSPAYIWSRIKLPLALRTLIPPLGNQWIFTMKATTIGVAIGFSDLFYIVSTSITQSGQTLELIAILMISFLAMNFTLAQFVNWLNARMQLKAH